VSQSSENEGQSWAGLREWESRARASDEDERRWTRQDYEWLAPKLSTSERKALDAIMARFDAAQSRAAEAELERDRYAGALREIAAHPWRCDERGNIVPGFDFVACALRALAVPDPTGG
jgi:hypothetical protein